MAAPLVSDALWALIEPLLPPEPPKPKGGGLGWTTARPWPASCLCCAPAFLGNCCRWRWAAVQAWRVGAGCTNGSKPAFGNACTVSSWIAVSRPDCPGRLEGGL